MCLMVMEDCDEAELLTAWALNSNRRIVLHYSTTRDPVAQW